MEYLLTMSNGYFSYFFNKPRVKISPSKVVATAVWRRGPFAAPWCPKTMGKWWESDGKAWENGGYLPYLPQFWCNLMLFWIRWVLARGIGLITSFNVDVHVKQNEAWEFWRHHTISYSCASRVSYRWCKQLSYKLQVDEWYEYKHRF